MAITCCCGTLTIEYHVNWTIHWTNGNQESISIISSCPACHRVFTQQMRMCPEYKNHCWNCNAGVGGNEKIRCAKCGYYICAHCGSHMSSCDGKMDEADIAKKMMIKIDPRKKQKISVGEIDDDYSDYDYYTSDDRPYDYILDEWFDGDEELMEGNMPDY